MQTDGRGRASGQGGTQQIVRIGADRPIAVTIRAADLKFRSAGMGGERTIAGKIGNDERL